MTGVADTPVIFSGKISTMLAIYLSMEISTRPSAEKANHEQGQYFFEVLAIYDFETLNDVHERAFLNTG